MREADREMQAAVKRREREADERIAHAWHIVALDRSRKLPPLDELLSSRRRRAEQKQTPEEMLVAMKSIFLAFGGDPEELRAS